MLDFFWVFQGIVVTTPTVLTQVIPALGTPLQVTLSEVCTGLGGSFVVRVNGIAVGGTWTGQGTALWLFTPATAFLNSDIVTLDYISGGLDVQGVFNPLADFATPVAVTNNSVQFAPNGNYGGPLLLNVDGSIDVPASPETFVQHHVFYRQTGVGSHVPWSQTLGLVTANKLETRLQLPFRGPVDIFLRSVKANGASYETSLTSIDLRTLAVYRINEYHIPEHAEFGEFLSAHAISYEMQFGIIGGGTILPPPVRPFLDPIAFTGPLITTNFFSKSTTVTSSVDEGKRIFAPNFGK